MHLLVLDTFHVEANGGHRRHNFVKVELVLHRGEDAIIRNIRWTKARRRELSKAYTRRQPSRKGSQFSDYVAREINDPVRIHCYEVRTTDICMQTAVL